MLLLQAAWLARRHTSQSRSFGPAPLGSEPPLQGSAEWLGLQGWPGWYCHGWAEPGQGGTQGKRPTLTMRREDKWTDVDLHIHYMEGWKSHNWGGNVGMQVKSQRATVLEKGRGRRSVIREPYAALFILKAIKLCKCSSKENTMRYYKINSAENWKYQKGNPSFLLQSNDSRWFFWLIFGKWNKILSCFLAKG